MKKWIVIRLVSLILAAVVGGVFTSHFIQPQTVIVQTTPDTKTVYVDRPVLTEKIITKILKDPKDRAIIQGLLKENEDLKVQVTSLSQTIADLKSQGGTDKGGVVEPEPTKEPLPAEQLYRFKDYQLEAIYGTKTFNYTLNQTFEVFTSMGKNQDGKTTSLTKVFQVLPSGERRAIPAKTTVVAADPNPVAFHVGLRLQGGAIYTSNKDLGALAGVQWLRRGRSNAAEDSRWAFLTPVVRLTKAEKEVGVLPFSLNVGNIKHSPFSNLWLSPYVSPSGVTQARTIGAAISATF